MSESSTTTVTVPVGVEPMSYRVMEQGIPIEITRADGTDGTTTPAWRVTVDRGYGLSTAIPDETAPWRGDARITVTEASFPFGYDPGDLSRDAALANAVEYGRRVAGVATWHRAALLEHHMVVTRDVADAAAALGGRLRPAVQPVEGHVRLGGVRVTREALGLDDGVHVATTVAAAAGELEVDDR